jgi:hypothetical protein
MFVWHRFAKCQHSSFYYFIFMNWRSARYSGLLFFKYDEIELSEKEGVFKLQFTGSIKSSKYMTKTITINKKNFKIINEWKRNNSANEKLFGNLKINNNKYKWAYLKPWFRLDMVRKIAISSLFFSKYLVLWQNQSAILESIRKTAINFGNGNKFLEILDVIIKDISSTFNHTEYCHE